MVILEDKSPRESAVQSFLIEIICIYHHKYITPLQSKYPFSRICKMTTPPSLVDSDASSFLAGALLLPKNCPFIPTYCGTYSALHIALFITNLLFYRPKALIYFKQLMRQHNGCFYKESVSLSLWVRRMGLEISGRGSAKR